MQHHFTNSQFWPFILVCALSIASVFTFGAGRTKSSIILLFFAALSLGFFVAHLDPFLILWDEQYHALVAKNMASTPFVPKLYATPLFEYDYRNWTGNHIWLHKQPLFLWQIALSLKVFGNSALAVRIPSIILHALTVMCIYRIGKIAVSGRVGYFAALFFAFAYYPLELVAGRYSTDHNDVAFLFYITASFWAWFEYRESGKTLFLYLLGLFAGFAILVKWLVGLLVYACWFASLGASGYKEWLKVRSYFPFLNSFIITLLVCLPWQLYIFWAFPNEAAHEFNLNTRHFSESIESHKGSVWYHFEAFRVMYGTGALVPILYCVGLFLLLKRIQSIQFRIIILSAILITYGFYSAAATKMPSFSVIVSPFAFLSLACLVDWIIELFYKKIDNKHVSAVIQALVLIVVCVFLLDAGKIQNYHTDWKPHDNCNRAAELKQMAFIDKLKTSLGNEPYVVFDSDIRVNGHIATMFFTDYVAYPFIPNANQINHVRSQHYKVAVFDNGNLPAYLSADSSIVKITL